MLAKFIVKNGYSEEEAVTALIRLVWIFRITSQQKCPPIKQILWFSDNQHLIKDCETINSSIFFENLFQTWLWEEILKMAKNQHQNDENLNVVKINSEQDHSI